MSYVITVTRNGKSMTIAFSDRTKAIEQLQQGIDKAIQEKMDECRQAIFTMALLMQNLCEETKFHVGDYTFEFETC